ncbi:MAG: class I SAM-dependent methyltransferase [Bacillota bacterium]
MPNNGQIRMNFASTAKNFRLSAAHGNQQELNRMIELLQPDPNSMVLDAATGTGHTALKLAEHTRKVIGIDITEEMLTEARSAAVEKGQRNIDFLIQDIHQLNFPDQYFDMVTCRFATHHFSDIDQALREISRVLKPGGKLYVLDCSAIDGEDTEELINRIERIRDNSHICSYSSRLWQQMLLRLPFTIEHLYLEQKEYVLAEWFDRIATPADRREEIVSILLNLPKGLQKVHPCDGDHLNVYHIEIVAVKQNS